MKQYNKRMIKAAAFIMMFSLPFLAVAQRNPGPCPTCAPTAKNSTTSAIGVEYKYHPGINIAGAKYDGFQNRNNWNLGVAFIFGSKKIMSGEKGFGILAGYRYALGTSTNGNLFAGVRTALWFNKIVGDGSGKQSSTSINKAVVFQPGIEAGYQFLFDNGYVTPDISYDYGLRLKPDNSFKSMLAKGKIFLGLSGGYRF